MWYGGSSSYHSHASWHWSCMLELHHLLAPKQMWYLQDIDATSKSSNSKYHTSLEAAGSTIIVGSRQCVVNCLCHAAEQKISPPIHVVNASKYPLPASSCISCQELYGVCLVWCSEVLFFEDFEHTCIWLFILYFLSSSRGICPPLCTLAEMVISRLPVFFLFPLHLPIKPIAQTATCYVCSLETSQDRGGWFNKLPWPGSEWRPSNKEDEWRQWEWSVTEEGISGSRDDN
jgi:hypothetical protein